MPRKNKINNNITKTASLFNKDISTASHINICAHLQNDVLVDKEDKLVRIYKCKGINSGVETNEILQQLKQQRNNFFKEVADTFAMYFWVIRENSDGLVTNKNFDNKFAANFNKAYESSLKASNLFENSIYIAIVTKPPEINFNFFKQGWRSAFHRFQKNERERFLQKQLQDLDEICSMLEQNFKNYNIIRLRCSKRDNAIISEPLSFIAHLINLEKTKINKVDVNCNQALATKRIFFNHHAGVIELRGVNGSATFAAILTIKNYCPTTGIYLMENIYSTAVPMIVTQSFRFVNREMAKEVISLKETNLEQANNESASQILELSEHLDMVASGEVGYGIHHFSICVIAKDIAALEENISLVSAQALKSNLQLIREDLGAELGFWAQIPGNFSYIARDAQINTNNLASFANLHNYPLGKKNHNHWGECVTTLETIVKTPYYFNFHYKDVGNTLIFGAMGSGKTTLIGFLLLQSLKFGGRRIIFDKDSGLEILTKACNGDYYHLIPGKHTGFNPCALEDSSENRSFLQSLFAKILTVRGDKLTAEDYITIDFVINSMYSNLPLHLRNFSKIAALFGPATAGSLRSRFDEWHSSGNLAWVFDNKEQQIKFNKNITAIDIGKILELQDIKTVVLMYLFYLSNKALEGVRGGIIIDEGWRAMDDAYFLQAIDEQARTPRKKNNFLCLLTQNPEDTVNSKISATLNSAASCKIFFPNRLANREVYINHLGLSEAEYQIITSLTNEQHYFLLNYAQGKESVIARANLKGMEREIAVISARESTVAKMRQLAANNDNNWLENFYRYIETVENLE